MVSLSLMDMYGKPVQLGGQYDKITDYLLSRSSCQMIQCESDVYQNDKLLFIIDAKMLFNVKEESWKCPWWPMTMSLEIDEALEKQIVERFAALKAANDSWLEQFIYTLVTGLEDFPILFLPQIKKAISKIIDNNRIIMITYHANNLQLHPDATNELDKVMQIVRI